MNKLEILQISEDRLIINDTLIYKLEDVYQSIDNPLCLPVVTVKITKSFDRDLSFTSIEALEFFEEIIKKDILPNIKSGVGMIRYTLFRPGALFIAKDAHVFDWHYPFGVFSWHPYERKYCNETALFSSRYRYLHDQVQRHYRKIHEYTQDSFKKYLKGL